jgi:hypothetical protein
MKKIYIITIILSLLNNCLYSQDLSQKDNNTIDNLFRPNLVIKKEKIVSDTLGMVFKGTFYMVHPEIKLQDEEDAFSCRSMINVLEGVVFDRIDTGLFLFVKDNFYLKTEKDVLIFEGAIDKLYPIGDPEDLQFKEHMKTGDTWYFIRGKFFDSKKGLKVTIDKNAKITGIVYDLHAIKAE